MNKQEIKKWKNKNREKSFNLRSVLSNEEIPYETARELQSIQDEAYKKDKFAQKLLEAIEKGKED